ncbi:DNA topoisomerase III [Tepidimonas charontis]|uniref:DNA topoisomerase n=1 Tax=Tepidimonas charontis TaxID=2267262 RepID=A0A554XC67_9BURK|nr:DNA topoisomerase III [Tepidimonas charontis]TSE33443.1 DNA topoisomerase 3 [Tepidimonas charontis]
MKSPEKTDTPVAGKTLVIAEKPSVALDIVRALTPVAGPFDKHDEYYENPRYIVTSAVGHLLEIAAPEAYEVKRGKWSFTHLPVIPPHFELKPLDKSKGRLNAIVRLARRKDVTELINACDAGREGELIFRLIEQYAAGSDKDGRPKPLGKPVKRLWLQSMTPQAIRDGFAHLRSDEQMRPLADAARSRSEADWLVGINGTRAMTAFNSRDGGFFLTTVGRVQTPTLAIVVEREEEIRRFRARNYWEVHATFAAAAGSYAGRWFDPAFRKPQGEGADAEARAERLWDEAQARAIAAAVQGRSGEVSDEAKPSTQACGLLYDLTSLQREANGRFGFSAKTTLALAQSLYEKHKVLTYPRTDARALPEDYLGTVRQTLQVLADSPLAHLAPHARTALQQGWVRPTKRVFDDSKVSDHFAIIPTAQVPRGLTDAEQKLYDLVVRRFIAVFFPPAEFLVTTRITRVAAGDALHHFKTEGKVLVNPGWMVVYGREAEAADEASERDRRLPAVASGERVPVHDVRLDAKQTRPPARYNEATLLAAMESAGKRVDDDELRSAMADKGLGTPATRAAIIEGLIAEKYLLRDGRELVPTPKAFQLMTLLRGLGVEELTRPELTGEWEHKLAQMERGQLSREAFMRDIAAMTERIVRKAKEYDRDSVPGDYATLHTPCPQCGGVVKENYRRYACAGVDGAGAGCGFSLPKAPGGRVFALDEVEDLLRTHRIGPLEGFRSKAGWPFSAELTLAPDEAGQWKLGFDFGDAPQGGEAAASADLSAAEPLGACPKCGAPVVEYGSQYVCTRAVPSGEQPTPSCDFKTATTILQQSIAREQMAKLLAEGRTDWLDGFVSNRTRRPFRAALVWDAEAGKVNFAFEPREKGKRTVRTRAAARGSA